MAQRVNGISGMIERVMNDCETVRLEDTSELAKMFARLERIAEALEDMGHDATDLAQLLSLIVARVVDGQAHSDVLRLVKQGVLALQVSYAESSDNRKTIDPNLMDQLQELMQAPSSPQDAVDLDEDDGDDEEMVLGENDNESLEPDSDLLAEPLGVAGGEDDIVIDLDGIDWKSLPEIDLDALEDKVAQEQSNQATQDAEKTPLIVGEQDNDLLAEEAQEIRAQLSQTGYIVFDQVEDHSTIEIEEEAPLVSEMVIEELDESGLAVMAQAVTAFLEDDFEDKPEIQTVDDKMDMSLNCDDKTEPPVGDDMKEDSFWTDAEPLSEPDVEVPKTTLQTESALESPEDSLLGQLALDAMTLDLDDMTGLGRVHTQLETLSAEYDTRPLFTQLTRALGVVIEKIILFECDDIEDPLSLICDGVTVLQQMDQEILRGSSERFTDEGLVSKIMEVAEIDLDQLDNLIPEDVASEPLDDGAEAEQVPIDVDQDIFFDFASEAGEHLETAESKLLELESHSEDTEVINAVFRSFHTIKGASSFLNLEDVTRVAHSVEDVLDSARKGSLALTPSILDVALESLDLLAQLIGNTKESLENGQPVYAKDVTYFLDKVARAATGKAPDTALEVLDEPAIVSPSEEMESIVADVAAVSVEPTSERRGQNQGQGQSREQSYVRVGTDKLDQLVNLVGELVIAQTQVSQNPDVVNTANQKLTKDISQLMKISTDIQEISMSMRMVPIRSTFERMARIVRDLSRKCGKQVRFEVSGEDTELDKNVVEELVDPLTHMVRNAVDHGIESEEDRLAAGKPNQGSVHLNAYHKGGNIVIELRDDGKGLDRNKIMKKAVERGLIEPDAQLSDEEVFALVFLPGFSTAEQISDISGRGVGMDVVRRNIEGLRGRVEVTSVLGKGSVFTICLPLTLAIIDGMVIGVGQERYILPMTAIVRSLRPEKNDVFYVMGKGEMIRVQEELLPVVRLYNRFGVPPICKDIWGSLVVIVESEGKRCGVMVDELLGMQQVVIKGLHDHLRKEPCLSGCAILGDGRVGLILDANGLVKQRNQNDKTRDGNGVAYRSAS